MMTRLITLLILSSIYTSCEKTAINASKGSAVNKAIENLPPQLTKYKHKVMVLGTFHFNRSGDGSDVVAKNHLDISTNESQNQIEVLTDSIVHNYQPTIIAVEWLPKYQPTIDTLYNYYLYNNWELKTNEAFQLGFRIAKKAGLNKVHCIDNRPPQPETVVSVDDWEAYGDSLDQMSIWQEYDQVNKTYNTYMDSLLTKLSLKEYLSLINSSEVLKRNKMLWLTGLVNLGYGDKYIGADLTRHWYRRNTRLFVNTRNLCKTDEERVLIIYGQAHKWILDELFEASPEFDVVQPNFNF
ncbi:DUF5694 domain-containing protein [Fulvivirga lutea]|uniref:Uncharacterized protein n=1 Tax=Fulvivirga lutea TaxID=2810512 RepID=A0A974WI37_9BACT|nr:DUF5694 domain-containing protein [Fulvivirga lutea]QSE98968.1 hypothetical protein JR347_07755 [Fulvivirga lutea]